MGRRALTTAIAQRLIDGEELVARLSSRRIEISIERTSGSIVVWGVYRDAFNLVQARDQKVVSWAAIERDPDALRDAIRYVDERLGKIWLGTVWADAALSGGKHGKG